MIVPRNRLLLTTAVVGLPASLAAAFFPNSQMTIFAVCGVVLGIVALDILISLGCLNGITIELPEVARFSRDKASDLQLTALNESKSRINIRVGLDFPDEIDVETHELSVLLPEGVERTTFTWTCTPRKRGLERFDHCYIERASRLGFWDFRGRQPVNMEMRVYPNLMKESRRMSAIFLNHTGLGIHKLRLLGKGREFEKLRDYIPGDSYEDIHWKAAAKRGKPVTKVYQTERTQEVYVVIDASRLSNRPAHPDDPNNNDSQLERFLGAALIMGLAAEKQGDNFGVLTFSDRIHSFIRAKNGKAHYSACRDALYTPEPQIVSPDYDELFRFIRVKLTRRALLVFLTSLDDPVIAESFEHNLRLISSQHLVVTNQILPAGCAPLFSSPDIDHYTDLYSRLGDHHRWWELRELERSLKRQGVDFYLTDGAELCTQMVNQYMNVKQRQIL